MLTRPRLYQLLGYRRHARCRSSHDLGSGRHSLQVALVMQLLLLTLAGGLSLGVTVALLLLMSLLLKAALVLTMMVMATATATTLRLSRRCRPMLFQIHSLLLSGRRIAATALLNYIRLFSLLHSGKDPAARLEVYILLVGEQVFISGLRFDHFLSGYAGRHTSHRALVKQSTIDTRALLIPSIDSSWVIFTLLA